MGHVALRLPDRVPQLANQVLVPSSLTRSSGGSWVHKTELNNFTPKAETVRSSETSVSTYQTTMCHNPEVHRINIRPQVLYRAEQNLTVKSRGNMILIPWLFKRHCYSYWRDADGMNSKGFTRSESWVIWSQRLNKITKISVRIRDNFFMLVDKESLERGHDHFLPNPLKFTKHDFLSILFDVKQPL
jgi:hypothetical protein